MDQHRRAAPGTAVRGATLAAEDVLEVRVRRHVFTSERSFADVMSAIYSGISQPDIGKLFQELAASTSSISSLRWSTTPRAAPG
jgi:hypothetical protein